MSENRIEFNDDVILGERFKKVTNESEKLRLIKCATILSMQLEGWELSDKANESLIELDEALKAITGSSNWEEVLDFVAKNCEVKS